MASPSADNPIDDHPFLRSFPKPEPDATQSPVTKITAVSQNPWPTPNDTETIVQQLHHWERFAVLAVQIDPPAAATPSEALVTSLTGLLRQVANAHGGHWFVWQPSRYGCVIPEMDAISALVPAGRLQADLASIHVETVSIGIAGYPLLKFDRRQSLVNAGKALDHGTFFGPNSCVAFDSVSLNISGDHHYQNHDVDSAVQEYQLALRLDADNLTARNSLGVCLAEKGDLAAARIEFDTVRAAAPNDTMAGFNIGLLHLLQNEPQQALDYFQKAYDRNPNNFQISYRIGKLLCELGQCPKALPYLEAAIALRKDWGPPFCLQGQCLVALGRAQEAIAAYEKAIKLNPNDASALSDLATLYAEKGENTGICLAFCQQSVLLAPDNGLFRYRLARHYHQDRQWEKAIDEYEKASALGYDAGKQLDEIRTRLEFATGEPTCYAD